MQTNKTSRLYNEGFQNQIVQVTSIIEYTGQITSIYNNNVRSIVQMATIISAMMKGPNAAGPRQHSSMFQGVPRQQYKQVLDYTGQKVGRVGESRQPTCLKHILFRTYCTYFLSPSDSHLCLGIFSQFIFGQNSKLLSGPMFGQSSQQIGLKHFHSITTGPRVEG